MTGSYCYGWYGIRHDGYTSRHEAIGELALVLRESSSYGPEHAAGLLLVAEGGRR